MFSLHMDNFRSEIVARLEMVDLADSPVPEIPVAESEVVLGILPNPLRKFWVVWKNLSDEAGEIGLASDRAHQSLLEGGPKQPKSLDLIREHGLAVAKASLVERMLTFEVQVSIPLASTASFVLFRRDWQVVADARYDPLVASIVR